MRLRPAELLRVGLAVVVAVALVVVFWAQRGHASRDDDAATARPSAAPTAPPRVGDVFRPTPTPTPTPVVSASAGTDARKALEQYSKARSTLRSRAEQRSRQLAEYSQFRMATYNVLGASHTGRHGDRTSWASGTTRIRWAGQTLLAHGIDVVSLQEFQSSQSATFRAVFGGTYDMWPGLSGKGFVGQNTVAWKRTRFELVTGKFDYYPYFGGRLQPYPRVLLRDRHSGVEFWVTSYHNPAFDRNVGSRQRAVAMEARDANALLSQPGHAPLIVAGDMNDRVVYFCSYAAAAPMHSASGGSTQAGCSPPARPYQIDWIMGSPGVEFTDYGHSDTGIASRTSDHPIVYSDVKVWQGDHSPVG